MGNREVHREQRFSTKVSGEPRSGRLLVEVAFPSSLAFALSKVSGCTNNRDVQSPSSFRVVGNSDAGPGVLHRTVPYQNPWGSATLRSCGYWIRTPTQVAQRTPRRKEKGVASAEVPTPGEQSVRRRLRRKGAPGQAALEWSDKLLFPAAQVW